MPRKLSREIKKKYPNFKIKSQNSYNVVSINISSTYETHKNIFIFFLASTYFHNFVCKYQLCDVLNDNIYTEGKWHERQWDVKRHAIRVKKISLARITVPWRVALVIQELFIVFRCSTLHFKALFLCTKSSLSQGIANYYWIRQNRKSLRCVFLINLIFP